MRILLIVGLLLLAGCHAPPAMNDRTFDGFRERQLTSAAHGHILTNTAVWSPDSRWIVFDTRSDPAGAVFDGDRIERVELRDGAVETLYASVRGACCGVVTYHPLKDQVLFILGPENPTPDWQYGPAHRQGVLVTIERGHAEPAVNLDARDLVAPFTAGALRGGSHVHVFAPDGKLVSFTYNDAVLADGLKVSNPPPLREKDLRNVGVSVIGHGVKVPQNHPRNHDGSAFSVLVTRTSDQPRPGSDEIAKAYEDAWVGAGGYARLDGSRQDKALAFLGDTLDAKGQTITELFIADLPADPTTAGEEPLQGTTSHRPRPPKGVIQRRLTRTAERKYPGLCGPRFWPRSSPEGSRIAFLAKDDAGVVQLWTISPNGGEMRQLTRNPWPIASAFSWSPDGRFIAHVMDNSVFVTDVASGAGRRLTERTDDAVAPRPEACVFSPDGQHIAYVRNIAAGGKRFNQIFVVDVGDRLRT